MFGRRLAIGLATAFLSLASPLGAGSGVADRVEDLRTELTSSRFLDGDLTPLGPDRALVYLDRRNLGREPWLTDGTLAGTRLVRNLAPGVLGSDPAELGRVGGIVLLAATSPATGRELWRSDDPATGAFAFLSHQTLMAYVPGEPAATTLKEIVFRDGYQYQVPLAALDATLYFIDVTPAGTCELWRSDGSAAGTAPVSAIGSWFDDEDWLRPCPHELVAFAGRLFFPACEPVAGCELWTSDGTAAGTGRFADLQPGPYSSLPANLTVAADRLYFSGCRNATGCEPWLTDGTVGGTHRLADVAPGPPASDPRDFTRSGRRVFFVADDTTGEELWTMPVELFYDGFEAGDAARWSEVQPLLP